MRLLRAYALVAILATPADALAPVESWDLLSVPRAVADAVAACPRTALVTGSEDGWRVTADVVCPESLGVHRVKARRHRR